MDQQTSNNVNMADVLDRLAGALEQQAGSLADLKRDVATLIEAVRQIEIRLPSAETPAQKPKPAAKKRK